MKRFKGNFYIAILVIFTLSFAILTQPRTLSGKGIEASLEDRIANAVVLHIGSPSAKVKNIKTQIDSTNQEVYPMIKNERTMVPIRFVSENLGANVDWNEKTSTVTISLNDKKVDLTLKSKTMLVNGRAVELDAAPELINERTFVPLRAVSEALGKQVFFHRNLIVISDTPNIFDVSSDNEMIEKLINEVNVLPVVNSYENLVALLEKANGGMYNDYRNIKMKNTLFDDMAVTATAEKSIAEGAVPPVAKDEYSSTNVQVQGVDEADVVKTDGQFIYKVNRNKVVIVKAYPANEMKVVGTLDFTDKNFVPQEIYVDSKQLVVIGYTYDNGPVYYNDSVNKRIMPEYYPYRSSIVKAIVFDIADKANIKQTREMEMEGSYISSRKIGSSLYLVSNRSIYYYHTMKEEEGLTPSYRDSAIGKDFVSVKYPDIQYFPGFEKPNYMVIGGVNLESNEPIKVSTYLGSGENIFCSTENLYVAVTNHNYREMRVTNKIMSILPGSPEIIPPVYNPSTTVYKFALNSGDVNFRSKGEVPGTILNQFSMDEHNSNFRIATTTGESWRSDKYTSKNNLFILDKDLKEIGKIEDIAPGERIYSVRFMGDRGYMVTFRTVDPLFVIDLKEATNPKILGQLKIPGYSDYLHPYDENHIIGFGKDAIEADQKDWQGKKIGTTAYYMGMKMAIFDVTDVANPIEKFSEKIGDRGTDSELLRNHKALLFSKNKNLLALPITLMEVKNGPKITPEGYPQYGEFTFQGAYVYNIDLQKGFKLKGRITHMSEEDYTKSGFYGYGNDKNVDRILFINDMLYTLSNSMIKANDINSLENINSVNIQ